MKQHNMFGGIDEIKAPEPAPASSISLDPFKDKQRIQYYAECAATTGNPGAWLLQMGLDLVSKGYVMAYVKANKEDAK